MKETFPGVMNMAVNTFLKISIVCKNEFVGINNKSDDRVPFIADIIRNMSDYISALEEKDTLIFYESIGNLISAEKNKITQYNIIFYYKILNKYNFINFKFKKIILLESNMFMMF